MAELEEVFLTRCKLAKLFKMSHSAFCKFIKTL